MTVTAILAALLSAAPAAHAAIPVARPVVRVLVQTEGSVVVDRRMLADIGKGVSDIWRPYADVTFGLAADGRPSSGALRLLITDRISRLSDGASIGWIEFVDGHPSDLITVSTTAATALLNTSRWKGFPKMAQRIFMVRALTLAIAHELGHYLLASRDHTAHGLMRGQMTADDVMEPRRSSYRLDRAQVEWLQKGALFAGRDRSAEGNPQ